MSSLSHNKPCHSSNRIFFIALSSLLVLAVLAVAHPLLASAQAGANRAFIQAVDRYVAKTGTDAGACTNPDAPCATLQYAIDQAATGDRVLVASGSYTDINYLGGKAQIGYLTKSLGLRGGYSPDFSVWDPQVYTSTLNAQGQGRVLYISGAITPTVEGFVIAHGNAAGLGGLPSGEDIGSGILVVSASATISDCQVVDNTITGWGGGGGIFIYNTQGAVLAHNLVSRNQARYGSAIMVFQGQATLIENEIVFNATSSGGSVMSQNGIVTLEHNTISQNSNAGFIAGGLMVIDSQMTLAHNTITENEAAAIFLDNDTGFVNIISNTISQNGVGIICWTCSNTNVIDNQINDNTLSGRVPGGIYGYGSVNLTISGNTIQGNHGDHSTGGIWLIHGNQLTITNNLISDNSIRNDDGNEYDNSGGGIYLGQVTNITITNNTITANQAAQYGGGMYINDFTSPATIQENIITHNQAGRSGGGIYLNYPNNLTVTRNTISYNSALVNGGGIYSNSGFATAAFTANRITHNVAAGSCGGIGLSYLANLTNNLVADNSAGVHGSGICLNTRTSHLQHNTVANNTGGDGSGIYVTFYSSGNGNTLENTILVSQTVGILVGSGAQANIDSTLWNGNGSDWSGEGTITTVNYYYGDPDFADPHAGDYHIGAASAARDVGMNAGVTTDFEGDPRPQDTGFDLGFDEYLAAVDFTLSKQAFSTRPQAGDPLTYVLIFANRGNITTTQTWITDVLPIELESYTVASTLLITPTGAVPFTWQLPDLAPGAGGAITITGWIASGLPGGFVFTNTAQIATDAPVTVKNRSNDTARAVVRLNSNPEALNDAYTTPEDTLLSVTAPGVMINDHDADGDLLVAILDTPPLTGSLALYADGGFTYQPPANYHGQVDFTYHLSDGLAVSGQATVHLTVTSVNDPPLAAGDAYTITEDTAISVAAPGVLLNDSDVDGDSLSAVLDTAPVTGTLSFQPTGAFTYQPPANFHGQVSFTYHARDGQVNSNIATAVIHVTSVNDAPVAIDDSYAMLEDAVLTVPAPGVMQNDWDVEGDILTAILDSTPITGSLDFQADGGFTYQPPLLFHGVITFTYYLSDGLALSDQAMVSIQVTHVNHPPLAVDDAYTITEDTSLSVPIPGVLLNDLDVDGDSLTAILDSAPVTGTLSFQPSGAFTYQPSANFHGEVSFTYHACDGLANSNNATVSIGVTSVNDAPVAVDDTYATTEDTALTVSAPGVMLNDSDGDGDELTAILGSTPITGSLVFQADGAFTYQPALNFNGTITFTYHASDGLAASNIALVSIQVMPVNDVPAVEAGGDQSTTEGAAVFFQGSFTDDGRLASDGYDGYRFLWNFGDGITTTGALTSTHIYADDGVYTVTLTVTDPAGASGQDGLTVTVANVAPILAYIPDQTILVGQPLSITLSFTDPGWLDAYEVTIAWGEGLTQTLSLPVGTRQADLEHTFPRTGSYRVTLRLVDNDGGVSMVEFLVLVNPYYQYLPVMRK